MGGKIENEIITLKVLFDKQRERVVLAESDNHFVDILFSFLTLPMGTVIKLFRNEQSKQPNPILGCINILYKSIENLDQQHFTSKWSKSVALNIRNPSQSHCRRLKLNIDNTKPLKYLLCEDCFNIPNAIIKVNPISKCRCGKMISKEMYNVDDFSGYRAAGDKKGVFLKGTASTFIITDDLEVIPSSAATTVELFAKCGVKDVNAIKEKTLNFGLAEILSLLKLSLLSKTPLTDMIMLKHLEPACMLVFDPDLPARSQKAANVPDDLEKMTLKVILRKSSKELIFVESKQDFINFLVTLPAITLGSMVKLLDSSPTLGCISNLSKCVNSLNTVEYFESMDVKERLLSPKLGLQLGLYRSEYQMTTMLNDTCTIIHPDKTSCIASHPTSPTFKNFVPHQMVKGASIYLVTDDLTIKPLLSSITVFNHLQVPPCDIEVREVIFGTKEAQRLMEAALISKYALSIALKLNVSPRKCKFSCLY